MRKTLKENVEFDELSLLKRVLREAYRRSYNISVIQRGPSDHNMVIHSVTYQSKPYRLQLQLFNLKPTVSSYFKKAFMLKFDVNIIWTRIYKF